MKLCISDKIKNERKENKWTQEELAERLNVSPQAVSRWETNMAFPDIELLPEIANLFEITVDELLGVDKLLNNDKIDVLIEKANSYYKTGEITKTIDLLEQAKKENPTNIKIIQHLIYALSAYTYSDNRKEICQRIIDLSLKIVDKLNVLEDKCSLYQIMAYTYLELGDIQQAKVFAQKLPKMGYVSDIVLSSILDGEEKTKLIQENIRSLFTLLVNEINSLLKTDNYLTDDKITLLKKSNSLIELMYEEKDYDYEFWLLARNNIMLAELYADKKDENNTCTYLAKALESADNFDKLPENLKNTSLLKNKLLFDKEKNFGKTYTQSEVELLLDSLNDKKFDFIRNNDNFKKTISDFKTK